MYIIIALIYFISLYFILRKRSEKTIHLTLLIILFINFSLHFLKQAFPPYTTYYPSWLIKSTLENICAVSTVFFPFIFLIKKQTILHDYMYFIGFCGGLAALVYPTEAINKAPYEFDVIRFYFCHINLIVIPLLAAILNINRPRLKRFWAIPLLFLGQETIICLNEIFLMQVGLLNKTWSEFLDRHIRSTSFIVGLIPEFDSLSFLFDPFIPTFFKTHAFNINNGIPFYFPVLWLTIPSFIYLIPTYIIISSPFWISDLIKKKKIKYHKASSS